MITLTPLSASAASSSTSEPVSYFLQLDNARILLDMGQRDYRASSLQDSWEYEEKIRELAPTLSLVLLSHSPSKYLGLYAYARAHWGLKCPVYATQATVEMGRVVCLAEAESWRTEFEVPVDTSDTAASSSNDKQQKQPLRGPFVPTVDEIHEAFDWITAARYNQPVHLGGELSHLLLTPFPSGHVLGGTLFKLRSPTSGTVLYAVGMNHMGERHLDGMMTGQGGLTSYADDIRRPDLLIVEGGRSLAVNAKRKARETCILDVVTSTLTSGHSVLMPCDPSPRLLELLVLLDQHWTFKRTGHGPRSAWDYPLCLVSQTATDMQSNAKSLVEWMGGIVRESSTEDSVLGRRKNRRHNDLQTETGVLEFSNVRFCESIEQLNSLPQRGPKLILAIPPSMSYGPSRSLFTGMASEPGNVILLTNQGEDNTLTRDLYSRWLKLQDKGKAAQLDEGEIGQLKPLKGKISIEINTKVPLEGAELAAWEEQERLKKEREAAQQAALDRSRRMLEADDLESDSDSEDEGDGGAAGLIKGTGEGANVLGGDAEDARTMSFDIFVKGQQTRMGRSMAGEMARFRMFPYIAKTRRVDSYGEGLDIGQWLRKGREIADEGKNDDETEEVREAKRRKLEEEEKQAAVDETPSKFVSANVAVKLAASIEYVDMDGMCDGQALKSIIASLQPRKMIVIKSTEKATAALLELTEAKTLTDVFHPATNESVKIGEQVASYSVQMGESIRALLDGKWAKFEGYEVAMVDAKLAYASGSTVPMLEASSVELPPLQPEAKEEAPDVTEAPATEDAEDDKAAEIKEEKELEIEEKAEKELEESAETSEAKPEEAIQPEDEARPEEQMDVDVKEEPVDVKEATPPPSGPGRLPSSLFIGDLSLVALKKRLASQSIETEFGGEGVLVCKPGDKTKSGNTRVVVRKLGEGRVVLEGSVSMIYFAVRKELYGSYAQVTTV